jgi:signal transduction histidine kinase
MKISTKLTVYFTFVVFILFVVILIFLHESIVNSRIEEEINSIQARGESHRDVLEDNYTQQTLQHIVLMESKTSAVVVVTDKQKNMIIASDNVSAEMERVLEKTFEASYPDSIMLNDDYRNDDYIVSVSSYRVNSQDGYIFMFQPTGPLRALIKELNSHFLIAGGLSLALMIIIHFILSKILTRPLIKMKSATERINRGDYDVRLHQTGNDEISQLSKAIQTLSDDLKTIKTERAEFLASISHELRTPLTYVQGYTNIAQRNDIGEQERREYLHIIEEETGTIVQLVENLFELAKLDENTFTIYKETVEICPFLNRLYLKVKPAFDNQYIQLHFNCTNNPVILADPIRLEQILLNLLDNAKKYSKKDTTVSLAVTTDSKSAIFTLEDEGTGIPEDEIPNIFTRLYRVEKSRSREHGGSGLGLSIVKELVEAHSGDIQVKSKVGKGTIIQLVIPMKEEFK